MFDNDYVETFDFRVNSHTQSSCVVTAVVLVHIWERCSSNLVSADLCERAYTRMYSAVESLTISLFSSVRQRFKSFSPENKTDPLGRVVRIIFSANNCFGVRVTRFPVEDARLLYITLRHRVRTGLKDFKRYFADHRRNYF